MAIISIQKPTDQPTGQNRLIEELKQNLEREDLEQFKIVAAFAKQGPLLRLNQLITSWRISGKTVEAILGIDQKGTSRQALEYAINNFDSTYIAHLPGKFTPTFHPKIYLFIGKQQALAYVGSNNLTVGGTETNLEAHLKLELDLPADNQLLSDLLEMWTDAQQIARPLDSTLLLELVNSGLVLDEKQMRRRTDESTDFVKEQSLKKAGISIPEFPKLKVIPPSPIPKIKPKKQDRRKKTEKPQIVTLASFSAETLVIQIIPHHNGEVFLSKTAVNQNPDFFGFPFTGLTTPKKPSNPAYPQREPDPIVNIIVFDNLGEPIVSYFKFNLNTVYYEPKSEIRITVPQDVVLNIPEYSVMVMRQTLPDQAHDYDIDIYTPGSEDYDQYLEVCNQTMPSGGKAVARRFGWL